MLASQPDWSLVTWLSVGLRYRLLKSKEPEILVTHRFHTDYQRVRRGDGEESKALLDVHRNWIISAKFFSCFAFQNYLFNPLFLPTQEAASRWWSYKEKSTKVQVRSDVLEINHLILGSGTILLRLKLLGNRDLGFLFVSHSGTKPVKTIMLTKEWLCRCCICSSKFGPCQEELE